MKLSIVSAALSSVAYAFAAITIPANAHADTPEAMPPVACVAGQFGDHMEAGHATGDAGAIFAAKKAVYSLDLSNSGEATTVTLVWSLDGHEVQRQSLDLGAHAAHWHTWGMRPVGNAKKVDVEVLDAAGHSLKTDSVSGS